MDCPLLRQERKIGGMISDFEIYGRSLQFCTRRAPRCRQCPPIDGSAQLAWGPGAAGGSLPAKGELSTVLKKPRNNLHHGPGPGNV